MSVDISCDRCGRQAITVWGEVRYLPGGGRHGTEVFHFCHHCVRDLRTFVVDNVPEIPSEVVGGGGYVGVGWMLREDYLKQGSENPSPPEGDTEPPAASSSAVSPGFALGRDDGGEA